LGLLLRGEVIWKKASSAGGSCAWGSFQRPGNPVLRDVTERVVIASKGRFDRALPPAERADQGLPSEGTSYVDEFMEATTDVWDIPAVSAKRVGHPAPFPVELPQRLIDLYTYRGDLVLDPFVGAGTTGVAAVRTGRHYVGFDTDSSYIELAQQRIADERKRLAQRSDKLQWKVTVAPTRNGNLRLFEDSDDKKASMRAEYEGSPNETGATGSHDFQARAGQEGRKAQEMARAVLEERGFRIVDEKVRFPCGVEINFKAIDQLGEEWLFDVSGAFSVTQRPGLRRTDTLWKALGRASVLHAEGRHPRLVLLTTDRPASNSAGHRALEAVKGDGKPVFDVVEMLSEADLERLAHLAGGRS
jgi:site-specific DNA-methyltransferase (adenine-specific)